MILLLSRVSSTLKVLQIKVLPSLFNLFLSNGCSLPFCYRSLPCASALLCIALQGAVSQAYRTAAFQAWVWPMGDSGRRLQVRRDEKARLFLLFLSLARALAGLQQQARLPCGATSYWIGCCGSNFPWWSSPPGSTNSISSVCPSS